MKKTLLLLVVLLTSFLSFSQKAKKTTFEFGPRFGLIVSELNGADQLKSVRASFSAGIMGEIEIKDSFSLYSEVNYSRQGATNRGNDDGSPFDNPLNLDYFNFPILIKYYVKNGFALEAGPQLGFLLNAKNRSKQVESPGVMDMTNDFKQLDFSFVLGLSYKTEWGFIVGGRYNFGLVDINDGSVLESGSLRNSVFQLHFGYLFK